MAGERRLKRDRIRLSRRHPPHPAPGKARLRLANPTQPSTRPTALRSAPEGSIAERSNGSSPHWGRGKDEGDTGPGRAGRSLATRVATLAHGAAPAALSRAPSFSSANARTAGKSGLPV